MSAFGFRTLVIQLLQVSLSFSLCVLYMQTYSSLQLTSSLGIPPSLDHPLTVIFNYLFLFLFILFIVFNLEYVLRLPPCKHNSYPSIMSSIHLFINVCIHIFIDSFIHLSTNDTSISCSNVHLMIIVSFIKIKPFYMRNQKAILMNNISKGDNDNIVR